MREYKAIASLPDDAQVTSILEATKLLGSLLSPLVNLVLDDVEADRLGEGTALACVCEGA